MTVQGSINTVINILEFIQAFIPDLHICKFQEDPIKTEWPMVMTRSETGIFSSQGDITDRLTTPVFELIVAFIPDLRIPKFQEDLIKT